MKRVSLPADQQGSVSVVPAVGAFDDPATGLPVDASEEWRFTATPDVGDDSSAHNSPLDVPVVVALIETAVARPLSPPRRVLRGIVQRRDRHPHVVPVRSAQREPQRNSSTICQDVPLRPALGAVRRVRSRKSPPFGAFTVTLSSDAHVHEIPFRTW